MLPYGEPVDNEFKLITAGTKGTLPNMTCNNSHNKQNRALPEDVEAAARKPKSRLDI